MKSNYFKLILATIVICYPVTIFATTIIFYASGNSIFIGADSKINFYANADKIGSKNICKIFKVGNIFFANSGEFGPDISSIGFESVSSNSTIDEAVRRYISNMKVKLPKLLNNLRKAAPEEFYKRKGQPITEMVICCVVNNKTIIKHITFYINDFNSETIAVTEKVQIVKKIIAIGVNRLTDDAKILSVAKEKRLNGGELVKSLLLLNINLEPNKTGLPINILEVRNRSFNWIEKSQLCNFTK